MPDVLNFQPGSAGGAGDGPCWAQLHSAVQLPVISSPGYSLPGVKPRCSEITLCLKDFQELCYIAPLFPSGHDKKSSALLLPRVLGHTSGKGHLWSLSAQPQGHGLRMVSGQASPKPAEQIESMWSPFLGRFTHHEVRERESSMCSDSAVSRKTEILNSLNRVFYLLVKFTL